MLIAQNETRESGSFMGDQLCSLRVAYMFVEHQSDVDKVIMSVSPGNEMHFLWKKFIEKYDVELVWDNWNSGDWHSRWTAWDKWRQERCIEGRHFDHYRELYLRIHGALRQTVLCGSERGLGRRNVYSYWYCGQEHCPEELPPEVDWFGDGLIHHPPHCPEYDVYISPHAKTQGNFTFTFDFWADVTRRLVDAGVSVTVGYNGWFCDDLNGHPLYRKYWGTHHEWMEQICKHKLVACGNTGTGWLAAACGVPMITMEPHNSVMADHRYRQCGLRNVVEIVDGMKLDEMGNDMSAVAEYVADRITEEVQRRVVMTTGCYDILHAGHVHHLEKARALGTRLIVALNSDDSVRVLKGPERPINPQHRRKVVLEALRCVDEVRIFDGPDACPLITELKPDILACGYGYTLDTIVGRDIVEGYGGRVVITYYGDARDEPSTTKIIKAERTASVAEVVRTAAKVSCNPWEKLRMLADMVLACRGLPGDMVDLGSYRGGTAFIMRRLAPDKDLHVIDTWEGTPYDDPLCHHKHGEWKASLEDCQRFVGYSALTHYWKGEFPYGFPESVLERQFCLVYVDMDTYRATRDAIETFWPRLVPGGKMVIDDWGWEPCAGVEKAIRERFAEDRCIINGCVCVLEK